MKIFGGRPMKRIGYAFTDVVANAPVYFYEDTLGRNWLAQGAWSLFRVETEKDEVDAFVQIQRREHAHLLKNAEATDVIG